MLSARDLGVGWVDRAPRTRTDTPARGIPAVHSRYAYTRQLHTRYAPSDGRRRCRCDRACWRSSTRVRATAISCGPSSTAAPGSTWPLNVGQIYNTLDRLERDGLVAKGETDEHGHVYYEITDAGPPRSPRGSPRPSSAARERADELAIKLAVAATLPGRRRRGRHPRRSATPRAPGSRSSREAADARATRTGAGGAGARARGRLDDLARRGGAALARPRRAAAGAASASTRCRSSWRPSGPSADARRGRRGGRRLTQRRAHPCRLTGATD